MTRQVAGHVTGEVARLFARQFARHVSEQVTRHVIGQAPWQVSQPSQAASQPARLRLPGSQAARQPASQQASHAQNAIYM